LPVLRSVANHYLHQNFGPLSLGIERAYGPDTASYPRYLLPDDLFDVLDIGLATAHQDTTDALGHLFCAQVGGRTGFRQADINKRRSIAEFATVPMDKFLQIHAEKHREYLQDDLDEFDAILPEDDVSVEQFIRDTPYIFTFHEISSLFKLPVADARGL